MTDHIEAGQPTMGLSVWTLFGINPGQCLISKWIILGCPLCPQGQFVDTHVEKAKA